MTGADAAMTAASCIAAFLAGWFLGLGAVAAFVAGYAIGLFSDPAPRGRT